mgnify:CR=1 FL=1
MCKNMYLYTFIKWGAWNECKIFPANYSSDEIVNKVLEKQTNKEIKREDKDYEDKEK